MFTVRDLAFKQVIDSDLNLKIYIKLTCFSPTSECKLFASDKEY